MDAVKFLEERSRMCGKRHCYECPLYRNQDKIVECRILSEDNAAQSVATVEKWAEEHPRKTRQSVFLEQWPDAKTNNDGVPLIWPCYMDVAHHYRTPEGICNRNGIDCISCSKEYWGQEVE